MSKKKKTPVKKNAAYLLAGNSVALMSEKIHLTNSPSASSIAQNSPFGVFREACEYRNAAEHLWSLAHSVDPNLMFPAATVEAFSCELFLKCLLIDRHGTAPPTHKIRDLFKLLDGPDQRNIEIIYKELNTTPFEQEYLSIAYRLKMAIDLESVLMRCDELFEGTRYKYEGGGVKWSLDKNGHGGTMGLRQLIYAIWCTISHVHPDWVTRLQDEKTIKPEEVKLEDHLE